MDSQKLLFIISVALAVLVAMALSGSAFRVDDTLFIWAAKQISHDPLDPYGFVVNWFGTAQHMAQATQNPPLTSYYIAFASLFFGWSERALHIAFLLPAVLCLAAVYRLARLMGSNGGLASLLVAVSPVFQLSMMTVMSDMWLAAFWCLACLFWVKGFKDERWQDLAIGAFFSGLAGLTKYFGLASVLLLVAYGFSADRRRPLWLLWTLVPAAMVFSWHLYSFLLYGHSHVLQATLYSSARATSERLTMGTVSGLAFLGGCSVFPLAVFGRLNRSKAALAVAVFIAIAVLVLLKPPPSQLARALHPSEALLFGAMGVVGAVALWAAASVWAAERSPDNLALLLWVYGTMAFATYLNWTLAGRNLLVLVPALAVVAVRVAEKLRAQPLRRAFALALPVSLLVALSAVSADSSLADTARNAADDIAAHCSGSAGKILFQGHWGFQYYMEEKGAEHLDFKAAEMGIEDVLVTPGPGVNTNVREPVGLVELKVFRYRANRFFSTMDADVAAGFYSSLFGPLPFGLGDPGTEDYYVFGYARPE